MRLRPDRGWRANSAPPNRLAGFDGPLRGGEREGRGKEGNGREKTPPNKFMVTALYMDTGCLHRL